MNDLSVSSIPSMFSIPSIPFLNANLLNYIKTSHLMIIFSIVLVIMLIISWVIIFHCNKYKDQGKALFFTKYIYLAGVSGLLIIALTYLILFSSL